MTSLAIAEARSNFFLVSLVFLQILFKIKTRCLESSQLNSRLFMQHYNIQRTAQWKRKESRRDQQRITMNVKNW